MEEKKRQKKTKNAKRNHFIKQVVAEPIKTRHVGYLALFQQHQKRKGQRSNTGNSGNNIGHHPAH